MTVIFVSVILIILSIFLLGIIEIRFTVKETVIVRISGYLFSLELSHLGKLNKRLKSAPDVPSLLKSLRFLLKRSTFYLRSIPNTPAITSPIFGAYRALICLLLEYSQANTGKLFLPSDQKIEDGVIFDLELRSELWVFLYSFVLYKIRSVARRLLRV